MFFKVKNILTLLYLHFELFKNRIPTIDNHFENSYSCKSLLRQKISQTSLTSVQLVFSYLYNEPIKILFYHFITFSIENVNCYTFFARC